MLTSTDSSNSSLLVLLQLIQTQVQFSTVLVLSHARSYPGDSVESQLGVPVLQLTAGKHYPPMQSLGGDILAIAYLNTSSYKDILDTLAKNLNGIAQSKIVLICSQMDTIMEELFQICWSRKMLNAIALVEGHGYYSYTPFPELKFSLNSVYDRREVFPNRMSNLHGYPLRLVLDGVEPRDFYYTNRKGEEIIGGYIATFIAVMAKSLNATLTTHKDKKNEIFYHTDVQKLFQLDLVDIFGGLVMLIPSTIGQSYPAEVIKWCLMLPIEPNIPQHLYYPLILESLPILLMFGMVFVFSFTINCLLWLEDKATRVFWRMFLKEDCFRALLGQSARRDQGPSMKVRVIYFLCCVMGVIFNTQYLAALNTLVTSPPSQPQIASWEDIRRSSLKVMMFRGEFEDIAKTTDELARYRDVFLLPTNNTFYHVVRNSLNRSYAYPVPTNKWKMVQQQQNLYKAPIFRRSDLCVVRYAWMVFLLNENSIFTQHLNRMILQTHQSGLYEHWVNKAFLQLVEADRIQMNSHREREVFKAFALGDMRWLWGLFAVLAAVDCGVFLVECICGRMHFGEGV